MKYSEACFINNIFTLYIEKTGKKVNPKTPKKTAKSGIF